MGIPKKRESHRIEVISPLLKLTKSYKILDMLRLVKRLWIIPRRIWNRHVYQHQHVSVNVANIQSQEIEDNTSKDNRKVFCIALPPTICRVVRLGEKGVLDCRWGKLFQN